LEKEAKATATLAATPAQTDAANLDDNAASMWPALYMLDAYVRQFVSASDPAQTP